MIVGKVLILIVVIDFNVVIDIDSFFFYYLVGFFLRLVCLISEKIQILIFERSEFLLFYVCWVMVVDVVCLFLLLCMEELGIFQEGFWVLEVDLVVIVQK